MSAPRPWHSPLESVLLPTLALAGALLLFGLFVALAGKSPIEAWTLLFKGAFGDAFSWQNTLQRAAVDAHCAGRCLAGASGSHGDRREGALVLGALACAGLPYVTGLPGNWVGSLMVLTAAALAGAVWVALAGGLRQWRGVNEAISRPAAGLHRHRAVQALCGRADARSGQS